MTKRNLIFGLLMTLTLGALSYAQQVIILKQTEANPSGGSITADDTSVALLLKYIGTNAGGGEVTVDAGTGDISLTVATVADTSVECPVSGALGGIIDVSNAACDTLGEACDAINGVNGAGGATVAAPSNFRCVILNGARSDTSIDVLNALAITTADAKAGLGLLWDSDVALHATYAILPMEARSIDFYLGPAPNYSLKPFPFKNTRTFMDFAWEDTSTCTGADTFRVIALNDYTYGSETAQNVYGPIATNTTTPVTLTIPQGGVFGKFGAKLIAREFCASSFAGGLLAISGYQVPLVH